MSGSPVTAPGEDWSEFEVAATVDAYLAMLRMETAGLPYSKADSRRQLLRLLSPSRTEQAVEFKHANVSAVMVELGLPYIRGYKPRGNYQDALARVVRRRVEGDDFLIEVAGGSTAPPANAVLRPSTPPPPAVRRRRVGRVVDYEALQAENRRLGAGGEQLVVEYERASLIAAGRPDLADSVRWMAKEVGDGLGFDVLSYAPTGATIHIEVKTTKLGADTPFYLSSAEIAFAAENSHSFVLYRVYDFDREPRFFTVTGDIGSQLDLVPVTYRARLR